MPGRALWAASSSQGHVDSVRCAQQNTGCLLAQGGAQQRHSGKVRAADKHVGSCCEGQ
jgi:hypothetical protein